MFTSLAPSVRFQRDLKGLDAAMQAKVAAALQKLLTSPIPGALRHHTLSGYKPTVHVIDVCSNHSYQITFNANGSCAELLRIGTHRQISRSPY